MKQRMDYYEVAPKGLAPVLEMEKYLVTTKINRNCVN